MLVSARVRWWSAFVVASVAFLATSGAHAQDVCRSPDPSDWPAPSRPYFMIGFDTSGSMGPVNPIATSNSCGYNNDRNGHARCAMRNMLTAFGGEVNFGLSSYPF